MPRQSNKHGKAGEDAAANYMIRKGYAILERNYRIRGGEIDIIAKDGDCLVFAEVKTRKSRAYGAAAEYVTRKKQGLIIRAALSYMGDADREYRFDVIEVYCEEIQGEVYISEINHIENGFGMEDDEFGEIFGI